MERFLVEVTHIRYLTLTIVSLDVKLITPEVISFAPGQDMQFMVAGQTKIYPIASPPMDITRNLSFCIEVEVNSSLDKYFKSLTAGSQLELDGPVGEFKIDSMDRDIFMVASNSGIAPFASMIPPLLSQGFTKHLKLLFGLRSEENVFYFDHFRYLSTRYENFTFLPILSRPHYHWPGEVGTINTYLEVNAATYADYVFYICDGKTVVSEAQAVLLKTGHKPIDIKTHVIA